MTTTISPLEFKKFVLIRQNYKYVFVYPQQSAVHVEQELKIITSGTIPCVMITGSKVDLDGCINVIKKLDIIPKVINIDVDFTNKMTTIETLIRKLSTEFGMTETAIMKSVKVLPIYSDIIQLIISDSLKANVSNTLNITGKADLTDDMQLEMNTADATLIKLKLDETLKIILNYITYAMSNIFTVDSTTAVNVFGAIALLNAIDINLIMDEKILFSNKITMYKVAYLADWDIHQLNSIDELSLADFKYHEIY